MHQTAYYFAARVLAAAAIGLVRPMAVGEIRAELLSFNPGDGVPPIVPSSGLHAAVSAQSIVGAAFVKDGVDFAWGSAEKIFNEPTGDVIWGVNNLGQADFSQPVDARIVVPGTPLQGVTSFLDVQVYAAFAGYEAQTFVEFQTFNAEGMPISTLLDTSSSSGSPYYDFVTQDISADIAYFRVSESTTDYGFELTAVRLDTPTQSVPEPSPIALFSIGIAMIGTWKLMRTRQFTAQPSKSTRITN